jgi:hypothetical protein
VGYGIKSCVADELLTAIHSVMAGKFFCRASWLIRRHKVLFCEAEFLSHSQEFLMKRAILFMFSVVALTYTFAGNPPSTGTIVSESSVDCGTKGNKKKQTDLVCQEYVVRTTTTDYHVRQQKQKDEGLLPINASVEYTLDKDKMKLTVNGKKYEFLVVSEAAVAAASK